MKNNMNINKSIQRKALNCILVCRYVQTVKKQ